MIGDCSACGYKKALSVTMKDGKELYHCHAGCSQNDVIASIRGRSLLPTLPCTEAPRRINQNTRDYIRHLWQSSLPAQGTLVAIYLTIRAIGGDIPSALRLLPDYSHKPTGTRWPVMLAAITDIHGRLQAVHRTYLARDGKGKSQVEPAKMTLGPVAGYAVHLAPAGETLALAEGIETALSVMLSTGIPAWSTISAGGIRQLILPPLPLAREVIICADNDANRCGQYAARAAASRWRDEGRCVRVALPPKTGTDFNDMMKNEPAEETSHAST